MYDLLWSDPKDEAGKEGSLRGAGVLWGPDATERFLQDNGLSLIVRSHQVG
jgi:serine/threonine-protein phosphatase 5